MSGSVPMSRGSLPMKSLKIALICLAVIASGAGRAHAATLVDVRYQVTSIVSVVPIIPNVHFNLGPTLNVGGTFALQVEGEFHQSLPELRAGLSERQTAAARVGVPTLELR